MEPTFSVKQVLWALASIPILVVAQLAAGLAGAPFFGAPNLVWVGDIVFCAVYVALACLLLKLLCEKIIKLPLPAFRIGKPNIKPVWAVGAVLLPLLVSAALVLLPGQWAMTRPTGFALLGHITTAVLYRGVAAGVVEELVFRGVIMGALEKRWGRGIAILVPSMAFGILHAISGGLSPASIVLLFVAGTGVGVLFSLITYQSGSVWNAALVHAVWNCVMIGGILHIGQAHSPSAIFSYALGTRSLLLTGGDFGVEASIIAIAGYLLFSALALYFMRRGKNTPRA